MHRFLPSLLLLFAVSASAAVTGTVIGDDGAPLAGARVRAFAREPFGVTAARLLSNAPDAVAIATSESGADGKFSIDVKGNATVDVVADAAGREPAVFFAADGDDAGAIFLRTAGKGRRIRVTADGKPLPNALVYLGHGLLLRTDAQGTYPAVSGGESAFIVHPDYPPSAAVERNGEVQLRRGAAVRGRVVARDGTTPVAGAVVLAGGWPLARSAADGTFTIEHPPQRLRALLAVSGNDAGATTTPDAAKPVAIRLGTAASLSGSATTKGQAPVAGATVSLHAEGELYSAITDAKGHYAFAALPVGNYNAQAFHPAYVTTRAADLRVASQASHSFPLLPRPRIRGMVLGDDHKPLAGAVAGVAGLGGGGTVAITTATGEFTLRLPLAGTPTVVAASKSGYATAVSDGLVLEPGETKSGLTLTLQRGFAMRFSVVDPDRQPVAGAAVDLIRSGSGRRSPLPCGLLDRDKCRTTGADGAVETRIVEGQYDVRVSGDFVPVILGGKSLTARSSPLVVTVDRGAEVSGRVLFSDGTPAADARIVTSGAAGAFGSNATADANGAFTLKRLPRTALALVANTADEPPIHSAPVNVTPPARNVAITIPAPARIEGRVIDRATSQPVTSFNVVAGQRQMTRSGGGLDVNSADGTFVLKRVQPGSVELRVTAPGYVAGSVSDLLVEEGKALTGVEVKLEQGARVVGHVTAGGNPAAGVSVRYSVRGPRRIGLPATTDANGDYVLDGVPPGDQTFDFVKQGFVTKRKSAEVAAGKEVRIDVDLDRGREIRGRVGERGGQAVATARITAATPSSPYAASVTTDADGQFTLSGLEDGRYSITARKNGFVAATVDDVDAASGRPVTLTLERGGTIVGRVVGVPEAEMGFVRVSASGHNAAASEQVDAGGNFTLNGIPDGNVTITAYKPGPPMRQSAPKTVEVINGSAPPVEIDFSAGITVRGRVTRNGLGANGGSVNFVPRGRTATRVQLGMIAADGSYEVGGLEPGDYDVRVNVNGGGNDSVPYSVVGNATFDIDLKGATVRGTVVDAATGVPLADVQISASSGSPQLRAWSSANSDGDGRFVLDMLPDGTFNVRANREHYAPATQTLTVSGGSAPPLELRLTRGLEAVLRIVDATTGAPLDGSVTLIDVQQKKVAGTGSGRSEDGATHVWAAAGSYRAQVHANGYVPQTLDVTVPGPEVRVAMTRAATLVITSRSGGRFRLVPPAMGGVVGGVVVGSPGGSGITVPPGGRLPITSLTPGVYEVDKLAPDLKSVTNKYTVVLTSGQTATLDAD
jgi:hypothetical protein